MKGVAVFQGNVRGTVYFTENKNNVKIDINITGLKPNAKHGFHIHKAGDLTDGCTSMCAHYNPFNKNHGCPGVDERHVGDLGNIFTDLFGNANYSTYDDIIKLSGEYSIIGRGLIIHADPDDCGLGGNEESLKTGNAGKRIACAVIGIAKDC
jgi:Cu-Zn family superoxide dismutase